MSQYEQLVKALRRCVTKGDLITICDGCPYKAEIGVDCENNLHKDAAAAIEALQAEMPKRGKWIYEDLDNFRKYKVTCPHCGKWFVGNYDAYDEPSDFLYCPHCGNICNPTNLDWENELKEREKESRAKMEVQE